MYFVLGGTLHIYAIRLDHTMQCTKLYSVNPISIWEIPRIVKLLNENECMKLIRIQICQCSGVSVHPAMLQANKNPEKASCIIFWNILKIFCLVHPIPLGRTLGTIGLTAWQPKVFDGKESVQF